MDRIINSAAYKEFCVLSPDTALTAIRNLTVEILEVNCNVPNLTDRSNIFSRTRLELLVLLQTESDKDCNKLMLAFVNDLIRLIDSQLKMLKTLSLDYRIISQDKSPTKRGLKWTAKSIEFVELSKALYLTDCFNEGNITYKDLFSKLCELFDIDISNPHIPYAKMRDRTGDRALFLSKLKEFVIWDMNSKDSK